MQPAAAPIVSAPADERIDDEQRIEAMARAMNVATDGHDRYWTGYVPSAGAALRALRDTEKAATSANETGAEGPQADSIDAGRELYERLHARMPAWYPDAWDDLLPQYHRAYTDAALSRSPALAAEAAASPAAEAVIEAARAVLREELDDVTVHPCDQHDDDVKARRLPEHMQALYRALKGDPQPAQADAPAEARDEPAGYGLSSEQLAVLCSNGLKPEEIGGDAATQHDRVRELVHWFARFARGEANPKWAHSHAFELAYFVASNGQNRQIDLHAIKDVAYLEGVNITPSDRGILERLGKIPVSAPADAAEARLTDEQIIAMAAKQGIGPNSALLFARALLNGADQ
ncbi:hypothetical protein WL95_27320 [Burkholderia cepacia]|nr:hypothetical protein WL95_27320 [Burkholderia cepacia]